VLQLESWYQYAASSKVGSAGAVFYEAGGCASAWLWLVVVVLAGGVARVRELVVSPDAALRAVHHAAPCVSCLLTACCLPVRQVRACV
jgi:hypothetical protein